MRGRSSSPASSIAGRIRGTGGPLELPFRWRVANLYPMTSSPRSDPSGSGESGLASLRGLPDRDCVILARGGSRAAQSELVDRHMPMIFNLSVRLLRRREEACDAAQEVFLRAFTSLHTFDLDRSFRSWLCAIAWNFVRDQSRRAKHRASRSFGEESPEPADPRALTPFETALATENRALVLAALDRLEPGVKAVIVLRDLEGLSYDEIAESFQCSLGTIKSRIHRARMELKDVLSSMGAGEAPE